jgi:hypothetical protein
VQKPLAADAAEVCTVVVNMAAIEARMGVPAATLPA